MEPRPVAPAPFGGVAFFVLFMLFIHVVHPVKLLKKHTDTNVMRNLHVLVL